MTFGGSVREANPREKSFVMNGGASKKYARVKVRYDDATKWTGLPRKAGMPAVGAPVRVECVEEKDGTFRAVSIRLQNPNEKPVGGKLSGSGR